MTPELYTPFVLFVLVMTGTPGVGNLTMMAIGQASGYRSALPFLAGTAAGMIALNLLVSFGLGTLFQTSETAAAIMKTCGTAYILYLAYKLLSMQLGSAKTNRTFTFLEGVFIHPLNPKSWAMSVVGFSMLASPQVALSEQVATFVLTFLVFQVGCHSLWGLAGAAIARTLQSGPVLKAVNLGLVTTMVGATVYALFV